MNVREVGRFPRVLPADDDHPYRTGAWTPNQIEWDATDLDVIGELPRDLEGVYLRNTENPLLPSLGRYHPFDGDGMLHAVHFHDGHADYRNRVVRTAGLAAELEAGAPLWAGIIEPPARSTRDGWGARSRLKDASSTDVVVHGGVALTTFYQCGDAYQHDPITLADRGRATWDGKFPSAGISAHAKLDPHTGELLFFTYGTEAPYQHHGVVDRTGKLVRHVPVPLPGPRLPHDMAFTEHHAIFVDFPLYWDPALLAKGGYRARFHADQPTRIGVLARRGGPESLRWFEASPTYALHFINAYEEDGAIVLDGFPQANPLPRPEADDGPWSMLMRMVDAHALGARALRWRIDLASGKVTETPLDDRSSEFPAIHGGHTGRPYRIAYAMTTKPGWFLFDGLVRYDLATGARSEYRFPDGTFASEAQMAPRVGATDEADGYLVTLTSDVRGDRSECQVFDARAPERGPIARLALPERITAGTHACWSPAAELARP